MAGGAEGEETTVGSTFGGDDAGEEFVGVDEIGVLG